MAVVAVLFLLAAAAAAAAPGRAQQRVRGAGGSSSEYALEEARKIIRLDERSMPDKYRARPSPAHGITTVLDRTAEEPAPLKQCRLDIDILWRNDVGSGVISAPLVADVEGIFENQVVVASHRYYIEILDGDDGHPMPGWPYVAENHQFVASPIVVDVNADGAEEVLVATKSGELLLFAPSGDRLLSNSFELPRLPVHTDWADGVDSPNAAATFSLFDHRLGEPFVGGQYVPTYYYDDYYYEPEKRPEPGSGEGEDGGPKPPPYVYVDPHILATPVLHDFNEDGKPELIVPVTYYFDTETYADPVKRDKLGNIDISKYVACSILIIDLFEASIIAHHPLDLTTARADWPAYMIASPTIADVDNDGVMDIVVGTSVGFVYAISGHGEIMPGFPVTMDEIHTQILVADVFNNRKKHLIVADRSGNVVAYAADGTEVWETQVIGYIPEAMALGDLDADGVLEVVVGTSEGLLYIVDAQSGRFRSGYPVRLTAEAIRAPPTLVALEASKQLTVVVPSTDGLVHFIHPSGCVDKVDIGSRVYSRVMADNVSNRGKMDLVLATADGEVVCLSTEAPFHPLKSSYVAAPSTGKRAFNARDNQRQPVSQTPVPYRYGYSGIHVLEETRKLLHVTGRTFVVRFEIVDERPVAREAGYYAVYKVRIYVAGATLLFASQYTRPGVYSAPVTVPSDRFIGPVRVEMVNDQHEFFYDTFTMGFNIYFYRILKWAVAAPLAALVVVLTFARQLDLPDLPVWR